jgi:hypothetical protein
VLCQHSIGRCRRFLGSAWIYLQEPDEKEKGRIPIEKSIHAKGEGLCLCKRNAAEEERKGRRADDERKRQAESVRERERERKGNDVVR